MGWPPRKRQPRGRLVVQRGDDLLLGAAGVGNQRSLGAVPGRLLHVRGDLAHRGADDHQIGLNHSFGQIDRGMGDGSDASGDPQADLSATDANDVFRQIPLRKAKPIDPPINPTPTMATFPSRFINESRQIRSGSETVL